MITLPITKVATMAIPPDFGTGRVCEERGLGMSITRTKRVMTYVRATEHRNIVPAKARWVRNLKTSNTSEALSRVILRHEARKLPPDRSEEHTSELQSRLHLVCRLLLEKKKKKLRTNNYQRIRHC